VNDISQRRGLICLQMVTSCPIWTLDPLQSGHFLKGFSRGIRRATTKSGKAELLYIPVHADISFVYTDPE
jgi:hypothetical protein